MCMSPNMMLKIGDTWQFIGKKEWLSDTDKFRKRTDVVPVPCGECPQCKQKWRTQLAQRTRYEIIANKGQCFFLTLTVNEEYIEDVFPGRELSHRPFQLFIKKLRNRLPGVKFKYLMCGEYGAKNGRPHYHAIIFGFKPSDLKMFNKRSKKGYRTYKSALIEECWSKNLADIGCKGEYDSLGFVDIGDVNEHTAPYMAKYCVKFAEVGKDDFEINGQIVKKPYLVYPRDLLGGEWFRDNYKQILRLGYLRCSNGTKVSIPRSYINLAANTSEMAEDLNDYLVRRTQIIEEKNLELMKAQGLTTSGELFFYLREKGAEARETYNNRTLQFNRKMIIGGNL